MSTTIGYNFKFKSSDTGVLATVDKINKGVNTVNQKLNKFGKGFQNTVKGINGAIGAMKVDAMLNNLGRAADGINALNEPGLKLSSSMADLEAITGVTGKKLDSLEKMARKNAKTFGGNAANSVESYKLVLSQLSPEIAKVPEALDSMGNSVSTTSKLMGGDTTAATEVLTTAMNQYQVSLKDPIQASKEMANMMNIMAAGAQEGSAELPQIKQALEQSGLAAKTANVQFSETNAAIQILDKAGKKGSEGGVALRNTLATLSQGRFLPKDTREQLANAGVSLKTLSNTGLSLADRLKPLRKIMNDQALVTKLFGKENSNAAIAMISGIDEMERLTGVLGGTRTAYEQAAIVMEAPAEKNARLKAQIDDFKISLFNSTNGLIGYASAVGDTARDVGNLIPVMQGMGTVIQFITSKQKLLSVWTGIVNTATSVWAGVNWVLNLSLWANPITWIVAGIIALVAAIAWVVTSTEGWGKAWDHTVKSAKLIFQAFVEGIKANFNTVVNGIMIGINAIKIGWLKFKETLGIGDSDQNQKLLQKIRQDTEARKQSIANGHKKVIGLALGAVGEQMAAINSIKLKKKDKTNPIAGIAAPSTPGSTDSQNTSGGNASSSGEGERTNQAIATGGTKHNYITINLKDLVGVMNFYGKTNKNSVDEASHETQDALLRVLAMAQTAGN